MKKNGAWRLWLVAAVVFIFSSLCLAQTSDDDSEETRWFSVDSLNAGLGQVPKAVKRMTPRESIRSFLTLTENEDFVAAAQILNLSELSSAEQRERGEQLARQLAEVLKRGEWLKVSSLPGRQDAAIEDPTGQHPQTGEPRRNLKLASLTAKGESYDIRLGRYRVGDEEPVWLVMPDSVSSVPLLYEEYGPLMFEAYIPDRFKASFGVLRIWEWIAIPVFLLLVGLMGWWVHHLVGMATRWLPAGSPSIFVGRIKTPVALVVMSLVTQTVLDYVVSFSAVATTSFRVLLIVILAWGGCTIALRLVDTFMLQITRHLIGQIDDTKPQDARKFLTTLYALRRIIILITVTAVSIYVLSQIQLFETLGVTLLASASVLAVLVGIAGQTVLGNILSSFQLSLAKPIRIGDLVVFEDQWCYVEGIFYTYIRLRVWNDRRLIVPVTYFVSRPFENLSVKSAKEFRSLELILHLSADIQCLREKFLEYAQEEDNVIEHHKLSCYVTGQTERAQTVVCYLMASDPFAGWVAEMNVREKLMAFIRDHHPEWWPREVTAISEYDVALGERPGRPSGHGGGAS
ncbi:mechanosensitive ion channel family protein [Chromohalobacter sp. TMW 2.2308]|uniref:Mechanosensitive ion channel family protein n=1 Tax=Chromohalobacter moromii TaxID=2860329 RepID=A0A9X3AWS0_9GAMM|nr:MULTISPECIES: mechanosensitive ion channel domain-containing protein [Chromohalobacter]MCK2041331.1 mechanosensitive ion channel family protein [Chromohalobacter moromii]MCK2044273.1 mechanosensitive ion channel family protein [Chromohalobacter moromii]MCT8504567.1 mechanosensitive ion channel family protein [Chromohalobacter moromii]MCT8513479.1 mechanosensitive ion channel family protein [Chromohalobacter sp. TMW 2.2271]